MFSYILYTLHGAELVENFQTGHSIILDGYQPSIRGRRGWSVSGVALYIRECFDFMLLKETDGKVECLTCIRIREKANILVGVCCRPQNQDEEVDKV